jgi:hypothetical protein
MDVLQPSAATNALQSAKVENLFPCFNMLPLVSNAFSKTDVQYLLSRGLNPLGAMATVARGIRRQGAVPWPDTQL